jgi:hypothetical protein
MFAVYHKDTCSWFILLTKSQWTPPPTQLQFSHSTHTKFVICDYAIDKRQDQGNNPLLRQNSNEGKREGDADDEDRQ